MKRFLVGINPLFTYVKWSAVFLLIGGIFLLSMLGLLLYGGSWNLDGERQWNGVVALVLQFFGLVSGFLLPNYIVAWGLGFLRGQPGGERGLSINDGVNMGAQFAAAVKDGWIAVCFWVSFPWLLLFLIDFRGLENLLFLMLVLSVPALFGSILIYPDSKVFRNGVYWVEVIILIGAIAIGVMNTGWRSITSEEGQGATAVEEAIFKKFSARDRTILKGVLAKAKSFTPKESETREQAMARFAKGLSNTERTTYEMYLAAARSETPTALAKQSLETGKSGFTGIKEFLFGKETRLTYMLTSLSAPQQFCGLERDGVYTYQITSDQMVVKYQTGEYSKVSLNGSAIETHGQALPFGSMKNGWALVLNGALPGETMQVDREGCVSPVVNITPVQASVYQIADPGSFPVKIKLQRSGAWTWGDVGTLLFVIILLIGLIKGLSKLRRKK